MRSFPVCFPSMSGASAASVASLLLLAGCSGAPGEPGGGGPTGAASQSSTASASFQRTVVLIEGITQSGQDMFVRGGIDHGAYLAKYGTPCTTVASTSPCAIPIRHRNVLNVTTNPWKQGDAYLDWYGAELPQTGESHGIAALGTPADWTADTWPAQWGPAPSVAVSGYGVEALNAYGASYWMLDVDMDCSRAYPGGDGASYFEVKTYISAGVGWEGDVSQPSTPYVTKNHVAKCGAVTVLRRGHSTAFYRDFTPVNPGYVPSAADGADGIAAVRSWASQRVLDAQGKFPGTRMPSPASWAGEVVYSIQVDRFNDGDPTNDAATLSDDEEAFRTTPAYPHHVQTWHHGGDLQGIVNRLDYLVDLGVSSLWITPVLKNDKDYHGYCTSDFTRIDPAFGTDADLRALTAQAHARGIRVILDVVVNHMCNADTSYASPADHAYCASYKSREQWGLPTDGKGARPGTLAFGATFFRPLLHPSFFNRCGTDSTAEMQGTDPVAVYGDFTSSMLDFDTTNYDFQDIFTDLHKYWIAYADVDGFRLDAAKHVTEDFIAAFSTNVRSYAASVGKTNFYLIGEVAAPADWEGRRLGTMFSDPHNPDIHGAVPQALTARLKTLQSKYLATSFGRPGLNAVFDFAGGGRAKATLGPTSPGNAGSLNAYYGADLAHADPTYQTLASVADSRENWVPIEIHDWGRFTRPFKDQPLKSEIGLSYLGAAPSVPIYYYGQEQGLNGDCHFDTMKAGNATSELEATCGSYDDSLARQDMFLGPWRLGSTVASINGLTYIGPWAPPAFVGWADDPYLRRDHDVYGAARRAIRLRRSCQPLMFGGYYARYAEGGAAGVFAFSRIDAGREMVIVVNTDGAAHTGIPWIAVDGAINAEAGLEYVSATDPSFSAYTRVGADGKMYLDFGGTLAANTVKVFGPAASMGAWDGAIGVRLCR